MRTTATRRMRRRPAASGASTSADPPATVEGFSSSSFVAFFSLIGYVYVKRNNFLVNENVNQRCYFFINPR